MTVVISGATGFIGRAVLRTLDPEPGHVIAIDHRWTDEDELADLLPSRVHSCLHLGWYAEPRDYLTNGAANRRAEQASDELARAVMARGCERMVAAGSSAEYAPQDRALREDDEIRPLSAYGQAKARSHVQLRARYGSEMSILWARIFNVTGTGEHQGRILPAVARSVLKGEHVSLSSGEQVRDFLSVEDVASALLAILSQRGNPDHEVFNVSSGRGAKLKDILTSLALRLGDAELLDFGQISRGADDPGYVVGDNTALTQHGWVAANDLESALDKTAAYWRDRGVSSG